MILFVVERHLVNWNVSCEGQRDLIVYCLLAMVLVVVGY